MNEKTPSIPLVSIALCTYNGAKYLAQQLDTLVHQTYPNIEIVAVDDCSTDTTRDILETYRLRYPHISVYHNTSNLGYTKNFEYAISICKGDFISISDQDDIWELDKIQLLVDHIGAYSLIYSDSAYIDENGKSFNKNRLGAIYDGQDARVFSIFTCTLGHSILFKRQLIDLAFPIPESATYDWWLGMIAINEDGVCGLNKPLTHFRQHGNNHGAFKKNKHEMLCFRRDYIAAVLTIKHLNHRSFFEELHRHFSRRVACKFNVSLAIFVIKNYQIITTLFNKSKLSRLNHLRHIFM